MASAPPINVEGLRYKVTDPFVLADQSDTQIQPQRHSFYRDVLQPNRSDLAINDFVGRLTTAGFVNPQLNAREGTKRVHPKAAAAYDEAGKMVALMHGYDEVSSSLSEVIVDAERAAKLYLPTPPMHQALIAEYESMEA